ncbi:MAG: ParB/RepB/Spo0J family partition protein [Deltaproteobacteria bacterium]|nr:ParB/RepB/Spo0J family partition protein [Deltaproteobacteria bacterium]MBW2175962.1 ParB/RepB/Spo0J family partition protein [Deltaproteobacteria bacterium]
MPKEKRKKLKKKALGMGLGALIPDIDDINQISNEYFQCDISLIQPNRYQPRMHFSETELEALSRSIEEQGVIQPLLLRKIEDGYELVAGERRLRAARMAGLREVPCVVKSLSDSQTLEMSIVENIQRENLNPVEEAEAYHHLISEFGLTQDEAAGRVGKSRSAVANFLRIRNLSDTIKHSLVDGTLSMGHARALLGAPNKAHQQAVWEIVTSKSLSVRETEALVKKLKTGKTSPKKRDVNSTDLHLSRIAEELSRHYGTKVEIKRHGRKGKVEIEFYGDDDLDRLLALLT